MMKYLIIIFFLSCFLSTHAQWLGDKDDEAGYIIIDLSEKDSLAYSKKTDTTHYYVVFERYFEDNNVQVYCNDSLIYNDKITTDLSIDLAEEIKIGLVEKVKKISIRMENLPLVVIYPVKGKYYIRVSCSSYPFLFLRFSKYNVIRW